MKNLREIRNRQKLSMKSLGNEIGVSESTISLYETGKRQPDNDTLKKLCDYFNVSADYLLGRTDVPYVDPYALTSKDDRDIAKDLTRMMECLEDQNELMFDGDPLSNEAKASILAAMRLGLEAAKVKNKKRFTPKKYRKE